MPPPPEDISAIVVDGGPGSLAAAWASTACQGGGGGQPVLIICTAGDGARQRAAEKLVSICAVKRAVQLRLPEACRGMMVNQPWSGSTGADARLALNHLLLDACHQAMKLDIARLIWPVHSGAATESELRTESVADACDRALLLGQVASLDAPRTGAGSRGVRIETPYADFTDAQLAELIIDLGAPRTACWWCEDDAGEKACGSCAGCHRWAAAFKGAGARVTA